MRVFLLETNGKLGEFDISVEKIQPLIDYIKNNLSSSYYRIEEEVKKDFYGSTYKSLFCRNSVNLRHKGLSIRPIHTLQGYEYYEDIIFNDKFQIFNSFRVRIDSNWQFKYIIEDCAERMPVYLINKLKPLVNRGE